MRHTVFTPVYNRSEEMRALFAHMLQIEYPKDEWEWLIVDDGSADGLKELVQATFMPQNRINIRYIYKDNGGIHTAQNLAIKEAHGQYITRIDSDDYLLENALIEKDKALAEIDADNNPNISGVVGICLNASDRTFRSSKLPEDKMLCTGLSLRKRGATGDRNYCIKTNVMKEFLIPEFQDTKWVPESSWLWALLDKKYKTYFINKPLSVCSEPNINSVTGQLQQQSLSSLMSMFYGSVGVLNESKELYSKVELFKYYIKLAFYAIKAKNNYGQNKIKLAFSLLKHNKDKAIIFVCIPFAWIYSIVNIRINKIKIYK